MELIWFQNKTIQVMVLTILMQGCLLDVSAIQPITCPKLDPAIYPQYCPMPNMSKEMTVCCDRNYQPRCCTDMEETKCHDYGGRVKPLPSGFFFSSCHTETTEPWMLPVSILVLLVVVAAVTSCCCWCFCREFFKSAITCRRCRSNQAAYDRL